MRERDFSKTAFQIIDHLASNNGSCGVVNRRTIVSVGTRRVDAGCDNVFAILQSDGVITPDGVFVKNYDKKPLRKSIVDLSEGFSDEIRTILTRLKQDV